MGQPTRALGLPSAWPDGDVIQVGAGGTSARPFVLPPRSPKLNGCVERGTRTHREEFYEVYDLNWTVAELRPDLLAWENVYNTVRPHKSLGYLTPQEYVTQWCERQGRKEVV